MMSNVSSTTNYLRVLENTGILATRFRCILTAMAQEPHNVTSVVLACVTLHNIIRTHYQADHQGQAGEENNNHRHIPGAWRQGQVLPDLEKSERGNNATVPAKRQRHYLKHSYL